MQAEEKEQLQSTESTKLPGAELTTVCQEVVVDKVVSPLCQPINYSSLNLKNHDQTCPDLIIRYDLLPAESVSVPEPVSVDSDSDCDGSGTWDSEDSFANSDATTIVDVDEILNNLQNIVTTAEDQKFDGMNNTLCYFFVKFNFHSQQVLQFEY